ncbi:myosin type-2 heavy chain 1-like [Miscanthus floridulus]|uniref:myosin type-2 heavy chain 1-like n=1 Tax=Miscanthus floridulus TaxID=154761 RepID=UPI00345919C3
MNTVDTTAEGRTALSPAASQSEAEKNTARILEMIEVYIGQTQASEAKTARRREVDHSQQLRSAMFPDVCLVAESMDGETETKANEGLGMESFASPEALGHCQLTTASPIVFSMCNENSERVMQHFARLNEELENAISEKTVAFERAKVLEERLKEQAERLQIESKRSQETEAAQKEALRENRALKQEMAEKKEELSSLKNNFTMMLKRDTQVEQRNAVLEDEIDHVNRLLEAEKSNIRELSEQLGKAVNEKNKLMTELETNNDGLAKIQGCIHQSLTAPISRLKGVAATTNLGHYQHLLARMDALGQVKEQLPKMLETIEIATSLSAYSLAAAMLIRLRAYHGDDFDLQRLVMPLHLNREDYARIRNAVDPLAAKVAQKY